MLELPFKTDRSVTVVGLGISNLPLVRFLTSHGYTLSVRDKKSRAELGQAADEAERLGARLILGDDYLSDITEKVIFRSPGIRPDIPPFAEALARGAILTSEMELFLELTPALVLGITGSDGKTTTTTLTGRFLEAESAATGRGRVFVGGNIGSPLLPLVEEMTKDDFAVLELSSFQLQTMTCSPHRSAVTNLSPNHLNWHTGMEEYIAAKTNIYRHAPCEMTVLNAENAVTMELAGTIPHPVTLFSSVKTSPRAFPLRVGDRAVYARDGVIFLYDGDEHPLLDVTRIRLPGRHNLENYMTAIALCQGLVSPESIGRVADDFTGVRHRLELVREKDGVKYYNSSIDSSPSRTAAALSALDTPPVVICGGYDKNIPMAPLAKALFARAKAVVLTGATADKIALAIDEEAPHHARRLPVLRDPDFRSAVLAAARLATEGDIVLLSPACASFDAFRNFEERGEAFRSIVLSL